MFDLDPSLDFLNHGSFGAIPRAVTEAVTALRRRQELNPVAFLQHEARPGIRAAAAALAPLIGTTADHLALITNPSTGTATVLASLSFHPGDRIVVTNHGYNAVRLQLEAIARRTGAVIDRIDLPVPIAHPDAVTEAIGRALPGARLLLVDWITSPTALVFPVAALVARAHAEGVPVLLDAAHAPGQVPMDLDHLGAAYVVGAPHKWLFAPRGTAFLYLRDRSGIDPMVISHFQAEGFPRAFDWTGTLDPAGHMALPTALAWYQAQPDLMARNQALAATAAAILSEAWGTPATGPAEMRAAMAAVRAPITGPATPEAAKAFQHRLLSEHCIEVPVIPFQDALWIRISAQLYNSVPQYERLSAAVLAIARA